MELVKFPKTENLTENVWNFVLGGHRMPELRIKIGVVVRTSHSQQLFVIKFSQTSLLRLLGTANC